jgi:hypothetical protein
MARTPMSPRELSKALNVDGLEVFQTDSPMASLAVALLVAALLENALMTLLDRFFIPVNCGRCKACKKGERCTKNDTIFQLNQALESFSKCADLALRLGLITPLMRENMALIATIRNTFAHHPGTLDFDNHKIGQYCDLLAFPKIQLPPSFMDIPESEIPRKQDPVLGPILDLASGKSPKDRLVLAGMWTCAVLNTAAHVLQPLTPYKYGPEWES